VIWLKFFLILVPLLLLLLACSQPNLYNDPAIKCSELCKEQKNLTNGPCLTEGWDVDDWVCDVASNPREEVDNLPENQCKAYREGKASHFVEVDEECNIIKVY